MLMFNEAGPVNKIEINMFTSSSVCYGNELCKSTFAN